MDKIAQLDRQCVPLDRLLQIKPRWVFMDDQAVYNGKTIDLRGKMAEIVKGMHSVKEFEGLVSQPRFENQLADVTAARRSSSSQVGRISGWPR